MKLYGTNGVGLTGLTLLAPVSWGTTYITVTEFLPRGHPLFIASMRVLPAGLALVLAATIWSPWRPRGHQWCQTVTLAVFNFGIFFALLIVAIHRLPGGVAAAVGGIQPLLVAVVTRLLIGDKPRRFDIAIGSAAVFGVALVVIRPGASIDPVGVLAAIGANISFSIGVVLTKRFPAPGNRLAATGWQLLMSSLIVIPLAILVEGAPPALSARNIGGFAYLSLAATGLAFVLWFNGIRQLPTPAPPLLGLAAPITGAALGWLILGESLSPLQVAGFIITIAAIGYGTALGIRVTQGHGIMASVARRPTRSNPRLNGDTSSAPMTDLDYSSRSNEPDFPTGPRRSARCLWYRAAGSGSGVEEFASR